MTAKEKAKELILKFAFKGAQHEGEAKQFVLIAVDEILNVCSNEISNCSDKTFFYWQEIKTEIELL